MLSDNLRKLANDIACPDCGSKTFYVVRVNHDDKDTHAAETKEKALELAMPDEGDSVEVRTVAAGDPGEARLRWSVGHPA
jgi:hypothetical protein